MDQPSNYCQAVERMTADNPNVYYHHHEYGFPLKNDDELFGRLILEINQAGLSWNTILRKQANFRNAYSNFQIQEIAVYRDTARERLLNDAGIIRNRLKINAAIYNAQQILGLQQDYGSFSAWLDHHHPLSKAEWVKLFKKHFKFVGGEIVNEFLMSTGYLKGAHHPDCPIYAEVLKTNPAWAQSR